MGKRSASYQTRKTAKRRKSKRANIKRKAPATWEDSKTRTQLPQRLYPSPCATTQRKEQSLFFTEVSKHKADDSGHNDYQTLRNDYQRLRQLLKLRLLRSHCIHCENKRQERILTAQQSLKQRMFSGETVGSRCLLAAIAARKKRKKQPQNLVNATTTKA